jgi:hypothetical protein
MNRVTTHETSKSKIIQLNRTFQRRVRVTRFQIYSRNTSPLLHSQIPPASPAFHKFSPLTAFIKNPKASLKGEDNPIHHNALYHIGIINITKHILPLHPNRTPIPTRPPLRHNRDIQPPLGKYTRTPLPVSINNLGSGLRHNQIQQTANRKREKGSQARARARVKAPRHARRGVQITTAHPPSTPPRPPSPQ